MYIILDFEANLRKYLDDLLNNNYINDYNKVNCKEHFIEIIMNNLKVDFGEVYQKNLIQSIYSNMQILGNNNVSKNDIINAIDLGNVDNGIENYNFAGEGIIYNNSNRHTGKNRKIKWILSYSKRILNGCNKEDLKQLTDKWRKEREDYPGWFVIPYGVAKELEWKTTCFFGKLPDDMDITDMLEVQFRTGDRLKEVLSSIKRGIYSNDDRRSLDAMEAAYNYIIKNPESDNTIELFEYLACVMRTRKEPSLVSCIVLIHNITYINAPIIGKYVEDLDSSLYELYYATMYDYEGNEVATKHKVLVRNSCARLAYELNIMYPKRVGEGVKLWLEIKYGDDFAEVVNEINR